MKIVLFIVSGALMVVACTNKKWEEIKPRESVTAEVCDTSGIISFASDITPILNSSCGALDNNCHTSFTATAGGSAGVSLDNYTGVQTVYSSGQLYGCLTGAAGFSSMPKPGHTLSACNRNKIFKWINAGAPNN